jgi:hypothetical protein
MRRGCRQAIALGDEIESTATDAVCGVRRALPAAPSETVGTRWTSTSW